MAEKKCVPCLRDLDVFIRQSKYLEVYIDKKDKAMARIHGMYVDGAVGAAEANECFPKELTDYIKSHVREMRESIEKEDWSDARWRLNVAEDLFTERGLSWIIDHCEKETRRGFKGK